MKHTNVILADLISQGILATDSNGKIVLGSLNTVNSQSLFGSGDIALVATESDPLSVHLDQTTPQTTIGTFTFPSVNAAGSMKVSSSSSSGGVIRTSYEATSSALSGSTSVIAVNVPIGTKILGCQLNVDLVITSGDGGTTWSAAYSAGIAAQSICTGQAYARNTNISLIFDSSVNSPIVTGSAGTITITCDGGKTFSGGFIRAVIYFEEFSTISPSVGIASVKTYAPSPYVSFVNVSTQNQNMTAKTIDYKFDITWADRYLLSASYDRCWVFIKYSTDNIVWHHATLASGGSITPESDNLGAFVDVGTNQTLRWHYGANSIGDNDMVYIRVFAIEMVYIPTGSFYIGSGGTESGSFTAGSWVSGATIPFQISSESSLTINTGNVAYLWGTSTSGNNTIGSSGTLPAAFPKGYNAFYIMKYKISQKQYADFLNTLTSGQASSYYPSYNGNYRYTISGSWPNYSASRPDRTCNYLAWSDLYAYTDWAALRPMTELEFEKACRGTAAPVANEYAWGFSDSPTVTAVAATTIFGTTEDGTEIITNAGANSCFGTQVYTGGDATGQSDTSPYPYTRGPLRCGIFATGSSTTRKASGASYYGVMELSGSAWERPVTVAAAAAFTGVHGDGDITTAPSNWPSSSTAAGAGLRGGSWGDGATYARTSDRSIAAYTDASRVNSFGGRCVRTSP